MSLFDEKTKRFAANSIFPSLLISALGFVLSQAAAAQMHGSWRLHVFLGIPGFVLSGLALFRARLHWTVVSTDEKLFRVHAKRWYLFLFAAGACTGAVVSAGSATLVGVVAGLTYFLPWTRIPVCRSRFVVSSAATLAGAVAWLVIHGRPVHPLYFLIAAWTLCFAAVFMHLLVVVSLDREYRICAPHRTGQPGLDQHVESAQT